MLQIRELTRLWLRKNSTWEFFQRSQSDVYGIRRSVLGWVLIRFDGGPSYPEMVSTLKVARRRYGHLISRGETIRSDEWIERIKIVDPEANPQVIHAIRTLLAASH